MLTLVCVVCVCSELSVEFILSQPLRIKAGLLAMGPGEAVVEHPFNVLQNMIPAEKTVHL